MHPEIKQTLKRFLQALVFIALFMVFEFALLHLIEKI